jgi:hypothetical protein
MHRSKLLGAAAQLCRLQLSYAEVIIDKRIIAITCGSGLVPVTTPGEFGFVGGVGAVDCAIALP